MRCNIINLAGETTQLELKVNSTCYDLIDNIEITMNVYFHCIDLYNDEYCITKNPSSFLNFVLYDNMDIFMIDHGKSVRIFDDSIIYTNSWAWDIESMETIYGPVEEWDVSWITDMSYAFCDNKTFNKNINNWDVSSVYTMDSMFKNSEFNKQLNNWNVSNVVNMEYMFAFATCFNQPLEKWDVSSVKDMDSMFKNAESFNQPLEKWDVSSVKDMNSMFKNAESFNQPLEKWDVRKRN